MAVVINEPAKNLIINTGNILSLNDITKKPKQNPTEELLEALSITLKDYQNGENKSNNIEQSLMISRQHEDVTNKVIEYELGDLKFALKLFVGSDDENYLKEALDNAFNVLNVTSVHNVIISYHKKQEDDQNGVLTKIKNIWKFLESYSKNEKVLQIGLADVEEVVFKRIYEWAKIKPSIIQINLASCCVVPPTLQTFCKENNVQLLTHNDPNEILPESALRNVLSNNLQVNWVLRLLVHIKCRGVLTTKSYLVGLSSL